MKKKIMYPKWVEQYRKPGVTIRKVRNGYGLYSCTSVYVKGMPYPKSIQTYLGMIFEDKGFVPKNTEVKYGPYLEYGLSHFLYHNFSRTLVRSSYQGSDILVRLGILYYVFNSLDSCFIRSSALSIGMEEEMIDYTSKISTKRIVSLKNKIEKLIKEKIPDDNDRNKAVKLLSLVVIPTSYTSKENIVYSQEVIELMERYGLSL